MNPIMKFNITLTDYNNLKMHAQWVLLDTSPKLDLWVNETAKRKPIILKSPELFRGINKYFALIENLIPWGKTAALMH